MPVNATDMTYPKSQLHPLTFLKCDTNSFHFPSCSIMTLISSDITYAKSLALQVSSHQSIIPASTLEINGNPYETPLQKNSHFLLTCQQNNHS